MAGRITACAKALRHEDNPSQVKEEKGAGMPRLQAVAGHKAEKRQAGDPRLAARREVRGPVTRRVLERKGGAEDPAPLLFQAAFLRDKSVWLTIGLLS